MATTGMGIGPDRRWKLLRPLQSEVKRGVFVSLWNRRLGMTLCQAVGHFRPMCSNRNDLHRFCPMLHGAGKRTWDSEKWHVKTISSWDTPLPHSRILSWYSEINFKMAVGKRSATGRRQGPCGQVRVGGVGMWSSWAFCKLVHISMPTPYLSIKRFKNCTTSYHSSGQRAARQFGDEVQENSKINSILLLMEPLLYFSTPSRSRLAWVVKSFLARCVTTHPGHAKHSDMCGTFPPTYSQSNQGCASPIPEASLKVCHS